SAALFASEIALRALRPVVRRVGLAADEQHLPLGAFLSQPPRAVRARQSAADQQVVDLAVSHRGKAAMPRAAPRPALRACHRLRTDRDCWGPQPKRTLPPYARSPVSEFAPPRAIITPAGAGPTISP